jgi:L-iditol 2-dehydrogenase
MQKMKAMVLNDIGKMQLTEWPMPKIKKDDDVLLKVKVVGVCGSDVHYYETGRIGENVVSFPYLLGHECSAVVQEVGTGVKNLKPGHQVVVDPAAWCSQCDQCKVQRENTCRNLTFLGTPGQGDGCLCEYIVMPEKSCFNTKNRITLEQAALCEPFTIGLYAVRQSQLKPEHKIAILGSGPIGLSCMKAAKAQGTTHIYMTEKIAERVEMAQKNGALWVGNPDKTDVVAKMLQKNPNGYDIAYECAGQQETIDQAIDLLKPGGKLILIGIPRQERISIVIDSARRKEITVINVRRQNRTTEDAIDLLVKNKVSLDFMVTHRYAFQDAPKAFELLKDYKDGIVKAIVSI